MSNWVWRMRPYFRRVAGLLSLGMLSGVICNTSVVLPAIFLGRTIDATMALEQGAGAATQVLRLAAAYVGASALYFVTRIGKRWWLRVAVRRTVYAVQADALRGVLSWPLERLQGRGVGDLMARIASDSDVLGTGFNEMTTELVDTWLFSVSLLVAMMSYDANLALLAMLPVPLALLLSYWAADWVRSRATAVRQATSELTSALQEYLRGLRVLRLYGRTGYALERVGSLATTLQRASLAQLRLEVGLQPVYSIVITSGMMLIVWLGGRRAVASELTAGSLVAFITLYLRFVLRGHRLPSFFNRLQRASVAYGRLEPMLAPPEPLAAEPPHASFRIDHVPGLYAKLPAPARAPVGPLSVALDHVTFGYPGASSPALQDVSLAIPAGTLVAVTGPIGSGKSALLRALLGLYPVAQGEITVGGTPVDALSEAIRAQRLAYVPQDPELFSGTIRENLLAEADPGGAPAPWLERAIQVAALNQDLADMPNGLNTRVGEGGLRVSGGQRQRVALARALGTGGEDGPGLILLDDPFAAVDVETEGQIIAALWASFGPGAPAEQRATIILCSHRLAAFPQADHVVVLDQGRVVAQGTHDELLAQEGLYARIYRAQHQIQAAHLEVDPA